MAITRRRWWTVGGVAALVAFAGAGLVFTEAGTVLTYWVGARLFIRYAALPEAQVERDLAYTSGEGADPVKHRLDFFRPRGSGWPTVVFVHGGGWTTGDKGLRAGGIDVYGNIGRYFAARGIGAAVISYRLLPGVDWREQTRDAARAVAWVARHVETRGGRRHAMFLAGHSAGAQLAARLAIEREWLAEAGSSADVICGVMPVSGAGYDLADAETYRLGADPAYYEERFARPADPGWRHAASPLAHLRPGMPPFLVLYASGESEALQRQSQLLHAALRRAGASSRVIVVPDQGHERILAALSRDDEIAGAAMVGFVKATRCR